MKRGAVEYGNGFVEKRGRGSGATLNSVGPLSSFPMRVTHYTSGAV